MKAIILAAGIASRLRPLTNDRPKCLLKIGDRSLLERTIDALLENNIREIIIVTGYLHEMLESFVQTRYPSLSVKFIHNELYATTNNIYSLWLALPEVQQEKEIILLDSDILFDPLMIKILRDAPHANCLALEYKYKERARKQQQNRLFFVRFFEGKNNNHESVFPTKHPQAFPPIL